MVLVTDAVGKDPNFRSNESSYCDHAQ